MKTQLTQKPNQSAFSVQIGMANLNPLQNLFGEILHSQTKFLIKWIPILINKLSMLNMTTPFLPLSPSHLIEYLPIPSPDPNNKKKRIKKIHK